MVFLVLLIIPIIVSLLTFILLKSITLKEFGVQFVVVIIIAGICAGATSCQSTYDTETISGNVVNKEKNRVSCSHSYDCHCRKECTGTGKNKTCTRVCDTCYDHDHDYDWDVETTIGNFEINRVDRQGIYEPPRWSAVYIGEPVAETHPYNNYIKAAPDSLFRHSGLLEKYIGEIPVYPNDIYDYYKVNRLVTAGFIVSHNGVPQEAVENEARWNEALMMLNADLGAKKQVNAIIVLAKDKPQDWYYALEQSWIGGKKNDAILVISVDEQMKPQWAQVMAWTTNKVFEVKLRDQVMLLPKIELLPTIKALHYNIDKFYQRKPMKDFEYLQSSITPSTTAWVLSMIFCLLVSIGVAFFCHKEDIFGEES